ASVIRTYTPILSHVTLVALICSSSIFFFYGPADHRDLHSFPTRRSSDLPAARQPPRPGARPRLDDAARRGAPRRGDHAALPRVRDRKSTRLNSSHDQISYAVFCLKKKNKKS